MSAEIVDLREQIVNISESISRISAHSEDLVITSAALETALKEKEQQICLLQKRIDDYSELEKCIEAYREENSRLKEALFGSESAAEQPIEKTNPQINNTQSEICVSVDGLSDGNPLPCSMPEEMGDLSPLTDIAALEKQVSELTEMNQQLMKMLVWTYEETAQLAKHLNPSASPSDILTYSKEIEKISAGESLVSESTSDSDKETVSTIDSSSMTLASDIPACLQSLNEEQIEAVKTTEGPVLVVAGAGSGKTRALTNRYVYLVNELGVNTANILCVTFTNKAAQEMKKRVRAMIGDSDLALICTFHGFCVQVLRADAPRVNWQKNFMILDQEDTESILKNVYKENGLTANDMTFKEARKSIQDRKILNPDVYIELLTCPNETFLLEKYRDASTVFDKIFFGYLYEQHKSFGLDFNDLILFTIHIFEKYKDVLLKWQKRLEYIMVDEYQDVSKTQKSLCEMLQDYHHNLFVVGDPDQVIYSFQGADVRYILNFSEQHPGTKTILMTRNYRSSPNIIYASNSLIRHNTERFEKDLIPYKTSDVQTVYHHAKTVYEEGEWIAKLIERIHDAGIPYKDFAILYRAHYVSRSIEEALIKKRIPYMVWSGMSFYERKEIKDLLCYLRMLIYQDDISFLRTVNEPRRNIGEKRIAKLKAHSIENHCSLYQSMKLLVEQEDELFTKTEAKGYIRLIEKYQAEYGKYSVSDLFEHLLHESGYGEMIQRAGEDERQENLAELKQSIIAYEEQAGEDTSLEDYLSKMALMTNMDMDEKKNSVKLMTAHSAKGLEFPYVFVCSMNEGIFPSSKAVCKEHMEEERRLAYVAMTRAQTALFLSDAEGYTYAHSFRYPSRFIFNIEKSLLEYTDELEERLVSEAKALIYRDEQRLNRSNDSAVFLPGDSVLHTVFGEGTIISTDESGNVCEVQFANQEHPRHIESTKLIRKQTVPDLYHGE